MGAGETGGRFALEIRPLWGFPDECDPSGRCNDDMEAIEAQAD
jgi:hypothetical protein